MIREPGHGFVLVVEESALYCRVADEDSMSAQPGHLLAADALPQVSLGIIPSATRDRAPWPRETFHAHEDKPVSVELVSAQVRIIQPSEIALCPKAFERLRSTAVHGTEARALVVGAIEALRWAGALETSSAGSRRPVRLLAGRAQHRPPEELAGTGPSHRPP
ncbi:Scr1 family TA system antitoxin-like transcriptional regulator [Streptomyces sp. JNUCC 63]